MKDTLYYHWRSLSPYEKRIAILAACAISIGVYAFSVCYLGVL